MKMTDQWNKIIYRLWAPIYDTTINRVFIQGRKQAMSLLEPRAGERLLIVGIGTGADLGFLPARVKVIGIDISPEMLAKAQLKPAKNGWEALLVRGDAQMPFTAAGSLDAALLNLILSVVPDGRRCLEAALQALKPGARLVVFDKFLAADYRSGPLRRLAGFIGMLLGTDINRRLGDLTEGLPCRVVHDEPSIAGGMYRVIVMEKTAGGG